MPKGVTRLPCGPFHLLLLIGIGMGIGAGIALSLSLSPLSLCLSRIVLYLFIIVMISLSLSLSPILFATHPSINSATFRAGQAAPQLLAAALLLGGACRLPSGQEQPNILGMSRWSLSLYITSPERVYI